MSDSLPDKLSSCEMRWYVVSTKPNHEKQAERNIGRRGVECFLPQLQEQKVIRRKRRTVIAPLFPGYLFVRINLSEDYRAVIYAREVRKIVEFGSKPAQVDVAVIDAIKSRLTDSNVYLPQGLKRLKNGQLVQIKDGPLVGLDAVFVREMPGRQRAMVLLHTLAFQARAEVDIDRLSPSLYGSVGFSSPTTISAIRVGISSIMP